MLQTSILVLMSIFMCCSVQIGWWLKLLLIINLKCLFNFLYCFFFSFKCSQCYVFLSSKIYFFGGNNNLILPFFKHFGKETERFSIWITYMALEEEVTYKNCTKNQIFLIRYFDWLTCNQCYKRDQNTPLYSLRFLS